MLLPELAQAIRADAPAPTDVDMDERDFSYAATMAMGAAVFSRRSPEGCGKGVPAYAYHDSRAVLTIPTIVRLVENERAYVARCSCTLP